MARPSSRQRQRRSSPTCGHQLGDALHNWAVAFLGTLVGASVFVAGAYWYLYLRPAPARADDIGQVGVETPARAVQRPAA